MVFLGLLGPWTDKVRRTQFMSLMSVHRALVLSAMAVLFLTGNLESDPLATLVLERRPEYSCSHSHMWPSFLSLGSGFAILVRDRVMWPVTLSIAHFNLFTTAIQSIYVTHALRTGSMTPAEIGIAGAVGGIIGLLSMMAAPWVWDRFRPVQALMATFIRQQGPHVGYRPARRCSGRCSGPVPSDRWRTRRGELRRRDFSLLDCRLRCRSRIAAPVRDRQGPGLSRRQAGAPSVWAVIGAAMSSSDRLAASTPNTISTTPAATISTAPMT